MTDGLPMDDLDFTGRHILIIEDEHIVAESLARALRVYGAEVVGPAATVEQALNLLATTARIDGALLDINLRGVRAYAVADDLIARGLPFVFTTGYGTPLIPERYRHVAVQQKPFHLEDLAEALFPHRPGDQA
jgi:CheY-like chemotaxis protein